MNGLNKYSKNLKILHLMLREGRFLKKSKFFKTSLFRVIFKSNTLINFQNNMI